jgi:hypothetical protein
VPVHDHVFSWTSHQHPNLHITGKWTGSRTISGTIRNSAGVVHHWAAEQNGFSRSLSAAAALSPKGGHYRAHLGGNRYLEFGYIAHNRTAHVFMIERREGTRWISSIHYSGTTYVHDAKFDFTGYSHLNGHYLNVVGHWTAHEVVEGTVKEGHGEKQSVRAHWIPPSGGGPN